jgi:hypothetical protein
MEEKKETQPLNEKASQPVPARPNETGTLQIDGFVKIFDPNTKEVYVEKRA